MNLKDFKKINNYKKVFLFDNLSFLKNRNNEDAYVINIDKIHDQNSIRDLKKIDNVFLFSWGFFRRSYLTTLADLKAYKNLDKVYNNFISQNKKILALFNYIYGSKLFEIALKKKLIIQLRNYYEIIIIKKITCFLSKKKIYENIEDKDYIYIKNYLKDKCIRFFKKDYSINFKTIFKFILFPLFFSFNQKIILKTKKNILKIFLESMKME